MSVKECEKRLGFPVPLFAICSPKMHIPERYAKTRRVFDSKIRTWRERGGSKTEKAKDYE